MGELVVLDRELYSVAEAARLLHMSPSTLRWWLDGKDDYEPVLRLRATGSSIVTWGEFVEAGCLREYRKRRVPLPKLRAFIDALRQTLGVLYPLAHSKPFIGEGRRLLLEAQSAAALGDDSFVYEAVGGQLVLDGPVEAFYEKIDWVQGSARRLFPLGRGGYVSFDPEKSFGAPQIKGIRTEAVAELVDAGEDIDEVAEIFGLSWKEVKAALYFESLDRDAA